MPAGAGMTKLAWFYRLVNTLVGFWPARIMGCLRSRHVKIACQHATVRSGRPHEKAHAFQHFFQDPGDDTCRGPLPLGAQWYVNYTSSLQSLSTHVDQLFSAQAAGVVTYVDTWMDMHLKVLRQSAALDDMISMETKRQVPILRAIADEYPWLSLLHTIAPDGKNIARSWQTLHPSGVSQSGASHEAKTGVYG